jgi:hypothetical protein
VRRNLETPRQAAKRGRTERDRGERERERASEGEPPSESRDPQSGGLRFADPAAAGGEIPPIGELRGSDSSSYSWVFLR